MQNLNDDYFKLLHGFLNGVLTEKKTKFAVKFSLYFSLKFLKMDCRKYFSFKNYFLLKMMLFSFKIRKYFPYFRNKVNRFSKHFLEKQINEI